MTIAMRSFFRVPAAAVGGAALTSFVLLDACTKDCAEVPCLPTAIVTPTRPFSDPGNYEIDLVADGKKMKCTVRVPSTAPASCTDQSAYVGQVKDEGITYVSVDGKYAKLSWTVQHDGDIVVSETFSSLDYRSGGDTGVACQSCPVANVTSSFGANEVDASVAPRPDASATPRPDASVTPRPDASAAPRPDAS